MARHVRRLLLVDWVRHALRHPELRGWFARGVAWNAVSTGVLAVGGIALSTVIARSYGASTLGLFNLVLAVYVIASQFAVGGLQFSVLKHGSQYSTDVETTSILASTALVMACGYGLAGAAALYGLLPALGALLRSGGFEAASRAAIVGIPIYTMSKVLLALLNAKRHMRAYATIQASRYFVMLTVALLAVPLGLRGTHLTFVLPIAESFVLVALVVYVFGTRLFVLKPRLQSEWWKRHLAFGLRALPGGALVESNPRIDVLMLGVFASDSTVGVYSLASMVASGILLIPSVLRINVNPVIARLHAGHRLEELTRLVRRGTGLTYLGMLMVGVVSCFLYPLFVRFLVGSPDFSGSWPLFCILMIGVLASSGYSPFSMLLIQTGYPGLYTLMLVLTVGSNVLLNGALIPFLGAYGAAAATASALVVGVLTLRHFARCVVGLRI
jgi:O-antigen/teichoic acid export membrane protein